MVEKFKKALKENGQSISWFYNRYEIAKKCGVTYGGFCHQLNGYAPMSDEGKKAIRSYLNGQTSEAGA